jgi:hypothetical protein
VADSIETLGSDLEVFPMVPNFDNPIEGSIDPGYTATALNEFGAISVVGDAPDKKSVYNGEYLFSTKQESYELHEFIDSHRGRVKAFWLYVKINEFTLIEDIESTAGQVTCQGNFYYTAYRNTDRIYLLRSNGDLLVRRVESVAYNSSTDEMDILVTPFFPAGVIPKEEIVEIGRVVVARFDLRVFEFEHVTDSVHRVRLRFLELPQEYPAT